MNPGEAPGVASSPVQSSSSGLPSRPKRKPPSPDLRTDELDVPESAGDATLRSNIISDPKPTGVPLKASAHQPAGSHHRLLRSPCLELDQRLLDQRVSTAPEQEPR
uniref:Uncharacterized protein n=1 Tax=Arundo donax TaxID=35708 RepID=A0A0A9CD28_ARUDO